MQHFLDQATENQSLLSKLEVSFPEQHFDWKTTIIFYIAVHWTRALLLKHKKTVSTHTDAKIALRIILRKHVYDYYISIENFADISRYNGITPNYDVWISNRSDDYTDAKIILGKLKTELSRYITI